MTFWILIGRNSCILTISGKKNIYSFWKKKKSRPLSIFWSWWVINVRRWLASDINSFAQFTGDIPYENSLLRQVSSLLRRLPAIESVKFQDDFLMVSFIFVTLILCISNLSRRIQQCEQGKLSIAFIGPWPTLQPGHVLKKLMMLFLW